MSVVAEPIEKAEPTTQRARNIVDLSDELRGHTPASSRLYYNEPGRIKQIRSALSNVKRKLIRVEADIGEGL